MEKATGKKLAMLDLNQKNNCIDNFTGASTKNILKGEYLHLQKTSLNTEKDNKCNEYRKRR